MVSEVVVIVPHCVTRKEVMSSMGTLGVGKTGGQWTRAEASEVIL